MGSGGSKIPGDKKIIIIGAGYGGAMLGVELMKQDANFTIIDVKDCFYHNVGSVRAIIEPDFVTKLFIPYEKTFQSHFKQGKVVDINPNEKTVILENGEVLTFDILVIATGSTGHTPFKTNVQQPLKESTIQSCNDIIEKVRAGKQFVIIGGGAVGCEIAGELYTELKDVKITLIQSSDILVDASLGNSFQVALKNKLQSMGVNIVLNERVVEGLEDNGVYGPSNLVTDKGNTFQADVIFRCTGLQINSEPYTKSFNKVVNKDGSLQVNQFLQVQGYNHIFALGDCNDVQEMKLAYRTGEQMKILKYNLNALFHDVPLKQYNPGAAMFGIGLSLGRNDAIGITAGGYWIPGFLLTRAKSRDLLLARFWKDMKQQLPR